MEVYFTILNIVKLNAVYRILTLEVSCENSFGVCTPEVESFEGRPKRKDITR